MQFGFHFGISDILSHALKHLEVRKTCSTCHINDKDEFNFILCCPCLMDLRKSFIQIKVLEQTFKLLMLISMECILYAWLTYKLSTL